MSFTYDTPFEEIEALKEMINDWADSLMMSDSAGETANDIMYGINEIAKEMKEAIK